MQLEQVTRPVSSGTGAVLSDRPGRMVLQTECNSPAQCVVNESYHPGWQATANSGESLPLVSDELGFLQLSIPPGTTNISLEFRPKSLQYGRLATGFGLGLLMIVVLRAALVARRR